MHETDAPGFHGIEALRGQEITSRLALANGRDDIGADDRWNQAETDFRERESGLRAGDRDIAAGNQADPTAESGSLHSRDGRLFHTVERTHQVRKRHGVPEIVLPGILRPAPHPVE